MGLRQVLLPRRKAKWDTHQVLTQKPGPNCRPTEAAVVLLSLDRPLDPILSPPPHHLHTNHRQHRNGPIVVSSAIIAAAARAEVPLRARGLRCNSLW